MSRAKAKNLLASNDDGPVSLFASRSAQALIETAMVLPILLLLILNAVNFGYLLYVSLNLSSATRSAALYSIQGFDTPAFPELAAAPKNASPSSSTASVAYLIYQDITGALGSASSASVQVCTKSLAQDPSNNWQCVTCSSYTSNCSAAAPSPGGACTASPATSPYCDPESTFVLNRVDITYTFKPLIPGGAFNLVMLASCGGQCTFHRQASMRVMG